MAPRTDESRQNKAVALRYRKETDRAPTVVAKGKGLIAEQIREIARRHGVPVREDNDLVELLAQIDLDREIPPELYAAVAEILSWVYRANETFRRSLQTDGTGGRAAPA